MQAGLSGRMIRFLHAASGRYSVYYMMVITGLVDGCQFSCKSIQLPGTIMVVVLNNNIVGEKLQSIFLMCTDDDDDHYDGEDGWPNGFLS